MISFLSLLRPASAAPAAAAAIIAAKADPATGHPIPDDCITFVLDEEDGSAAYYMAHYDHWDWPGGSSGPTAGPGYDCGYCKPAEIEADWTDILPADMVARMVAASGLTGEAAHQFVLAHRDEITVTWDQSLREFTGREVPKWQARIEAVLPNYERLPGDCEGAIFSLTYNRGTGGYHDPGTRFYEMREIEALMASPKFALTSTYLAPVPGYIASMARLWPNVSDLRNRRAHEAALFKQGLATLPA